MVSYRHLVNYINQSDKKALFLTFTIKTESLFKTHSFDKRRQLQDVLKRLPTKLIRKNSSILYLEFGVSFFRFYIQSYICKTRGLFSCWYLWFERNVFIILIAIANLIRNFKYDLFQIEMLNINEWGMSSSKLLLQIQIPYLLPFCDSKLSIKIHELRHLKMPPC